MLLVPPNATPLEFNGIRYQQDIETDFEGREYGATYLAAIDIVTGKFLWAVKICDCIKHAPGAPAKTSYLDITKITQGLTENELMVETVIGAQYLVNLQIHTATRIPKPALPKKRRRIETPDPSDPPMPPPWSRGRKK